MVEGTIACVFKNIMQNLWLLKEILDPEDTGSVSDTPVTVFYGDIVFSDAKFSFEEKLSEMDGVI